MKYYARTTHNFNNEARRWEPRDLKDLPETNTPYWSLGVHALEPDRWMHLSEIVTATVEAFEYGAAGPEGEEAISQLKAAYPATYRETLKCDILEDLELLIEADYVRVKETEDMIAEANK
jgi:hypothetical protein